MALHIVNGPNLNLLGQREPEKYGHASFEAYLDALRATFPELELCHYQSNVEGELINHLHDVGFSSDGIVLNAGGYTHTSVALRDAVAAIPASVIEVHATAAVTQEDDLDILPDSGNSPNLKMSAENDFIPHKLIIF